MTTQVPPRQVTPVQRSRIEKIIWASPFVWLCLIVMLLNFASYPLAHKNAHKWASNKNADAVISNFQKLPETPDVVLMGSSLMRFPFWMSDLRHASNVATFDDYSYCDYLGKLVSQQAKHKVSPFDMAIDAAMVSDVYLICEKLFVAPKTPRMIVYGVNPRDFMDDLLPSDTGTFPFARLHGLDDLFRSDGLFATSGWEKADLLLQSAFPIYRYRRQWQDELSKSWSKALPAPVSKQPEEASTAMVAQIAKLAGVDRAEMRNAEWINSVGEYEARWAKLNPEQFRLQARYLDAFLALAQARKIKVLLVKMPLTQTNKSLMPSGLAAAYDQVVAYEASRWNIKVIDIKEQFKPAKYYFFDIVHLNGQGGDVLTQTVASNVALALRENAPPNPAVAPNP
jgi:hypothetical protein